MNDKYCPNETAEEITLAQYLDGRDFVHWHVANETWTSSWQQKAKNKAMGVKSGVSDHWVILPMSDGSRIMLAIELKRQHGNTPTDEQIQFMLDVERIDNCGAVCCYGADEAIKVIEELESGKFDTYDKCWERTLKIKENRKKRQKIKKIKENTENELPY